MCCMLVFNITSVSGSNKCTVHLRYNRIYFHLLNTKPINSIDQKKKSSNMTCKPHDQSAKPLLKQHQVPAEVTKDKHRTLNSQIFKSSFWRLNQPATEVVYRRCGWRHSHHHWIYSFLYWHFKVYPYSIRIHNHLTPDCENQNTQLG